MINDSIFLTPLLFTVVTLVNSFYSGHSVNGDEDEHFAGKHDRTVPSLENLNKEESLAYDEELTKRLMIFKRQRELYQKQMFYTEREQKEQDLIKQSRQMAKGKLNVLDELQFSLNAANARNTRGKKDNFEIAPYEHGVFKLEGLKNLFIWTQDEKSFIDENKDDLKGKILKLEKAKKVYLGEDLEEKLYPVCKKDVSKEPLFDDPKQLEFLKGVYYNFLERSKINRTVEDEEIDDLLFKGMNQALNLTNDEKKNFSKNVQLHILIGVFERMPQIEDDFFPTYLPIKMPQFYLDYYYNNVSVTPKEIVQIYLNMDDSLVRTNNPRTNRICGHSCYELSTYVSSGANWNFKLNLTHNETFAGKTINMFGNHDDFEALNLFHNMTNCLPQVGGMVINLHAPYTAYIPNAVAYCSGEPWLVIIKKPFMKKNTNASEVLSKIHYLQRSRNSEKLIKIRKHTKQYGEVQLGLGVMYLKKCYFGIYFNIVKKLVLTEIMFDEKFFEKMFVSTYSTYFSKLVPRLAESSYG